MTREELIAELTAMHYKDGVERRDSEADHACADELLLQFIDDSRIRAAYAAVEKWYA